MAAGGGSGGLFGDDAATFSLKLSSAPRMLYAECLVSAASAAVNTALTVRVRPLYDWRSWRGDFRGDKAGCLVGPWWPLSPAAAASLLCSFFCAMAWRTLHSLASFAPVPIERLPTSLFQMPCRVRSIRGDMFGLVTNTDACACRMIAFAPLPSWCGGAAPRQDASSSSLCAKLQREP